ncbi:MAG: hypothetical protein A2992_09460 [Elusimicrobia bacterium RIFCSPLOWO2_01_FULL_59_12]|nr:MAG: hypothetical protein A2992_09460 [Elusimicrobia bacterium RIFCSPLOWO2_01_FULL_59_12]
MPRFAVILPVYNEAITIASTLREFYTELVSKLDEAVLIVAEDGSTDGTREILRDLKAEIPFQLISSRERKGYTKAVRDALALSSADWILFSDSDGQHDPRDFFSLSEVALQYDIVSGYKKHRHDPFYRLVVSRVYNVLIGMLFGVWFRDINSGFKVIRRDVIKAVLPQVKDLPHCVMSEFMLKAHLAGFRIREMPVAHRARRQGQSLFNWRNLPAVAMRIFKGLRMIRREISGRSQQFRNEGTQNGR